jgi:hypothetical protein
MKRARMRPLLLALLCVLAGCDPDETTEIPPADDWQLAQAGLPGALLSAWGTSASDVWIVGADAGDGTGPLVLHYDGSAWERMMTGLTQGDFWWVFGFASGPIYMGGAGGVIVRYQAGAFTPMTTPTTDTVFGIWGSAPDDLWAVGGTADTNGFAWRLEGDAWLAEPSMPALPDAAIWKVFGKSADDAWLVGSNGVSFHWDGAMLTEGDTGIGSSLFTVHANGERFAAVGGLASGVLVENDGSGWTTAFEAPYGLTGVVLGAGDTGFAVGQYCSVYSRDAAGWHEIDIDMDIQLDLHGTWLDDEGGVWAVGGQTASTPLTEGIVLHRGEPIAEGGI